MSDEGAQNPPAEGEEEAPPAEPQETRSLFQIVFEAHSAEVCREVSRVARQPQPDEDGPPAEPFASDAFVYSEIGPEQVAKILDLAEPFLREGAGAAVDLGSGAGKVVIALAEAAATGGRGGLDKVVGIEAVSELHAIAQAAGEAFMEKRLGEPPSVQFIAGDFVEQAADEGSDLRGLRDGAKLIVAVSTCFGERELSAIRQIAGPSCVVVTFGQLLPNVDDGCQVVASDRIKCDWGEASVFVHLTDAAGDVEPAGDEE